MKMIHFSNHPCLPILTKKKKKFFSLISFPHTKLNILHPIKKEYSTLFNKKVNKIYNKAHASPVLHLHYVGSVLRSMTFRLHCLTVATGLFYSFFIVYCAVYDN